MAKPKFETKAFKFYNQDETEVQKSEISKKVKRHIIKAQGQVANIDNNKIPMLKQDIEELKADLEDAKENLENSYLAVLVEFEQYIAGITDAKNKVAAVEDKIASKEQEIASAKESKENYESLLERLGA